ncbi:hypothetical protein RRG08_039245 [Elysia crispata]|uniref:Uncharacterized protein n=1 Tax=Elysia crispata TaxID=231223 RepID=A0AAE1BDK2_9GAST|nr:hypothetical protein RRG08_039245 [Elysia crispata]
MRQVEKRRGVWKDRRGVLYQCGDIHQQPLICLVHASDLLRSNRGCPHKCLLSLPYNTSRSSKHQASDATAVFAVTGRASANQRPQLGREGAVVCLEDTPPTVTSAATLCRALPACGRQYWLFDL